MQRSQARLSSLVLFLALIPSVALADDGLCGEPFTPIYEIQGSGDSSPLDGNTVTTEGVVTVDLQKTDERQGFFLQAIEGDGDPTTSDGILVYHQDTWGFNVNVGDHVRITATIDEYFGMTELSNVDVDTAEVCGTAKVKPLRIKTRDFNGAPEQYEGMFLQFKGQLFVTDTYNLHTYGEIWLGDDGVIEQPTNEYPGDADPDSAMNRLAADNMNQSVMIEDGSRYTNPATVPFLRAGGTLRIGDRTRNPEGAILYDFGEYKMTNSTEPVFRATNRRPRAPHVEGETLVATFNVLNYWTTLGGRGASTGEQLVAQQEKLVAAIRGMGAEIIGLEEMENNEPETIQTLVDALNDAEGEDVWSWVEGFEQNVYPIVNEIIYRNDKVDPVGDPMTLIDPAFDDFRGGSSAPDDQLGRRPVAQTFQVGKAKCTIVVNHFKSKSPSGATGADEAQGDGQAAYNARRVLQAQAVLNWIPDIVEASGDPDVLVVGDLNAYLDEDPVLTLESELVNLERRYVKDPYSYSYFNRADAPYIGRGSLDHALSTQSMKSQVRDADHWAINSDEPRVLDWYDPSTLAPGPYRSSDHDPLVIGLNLRVDH
jgi:predicted extracellular nuclease